MRVRNVILLLGAALVVALWSPLMVTRDRPVAERAPLTPGSLQRQTKWPLLGRWLHGGLIDDKPHHPEPHVARQTLARYGGKVFQLYCIQCHGRSGRGDGPRAPLFNPAPRDLTRAIYKFRSTPRGSLPTRRDLFITISGGLRGTGMAAFADLPERQRWALVEYVRTLSPRFSAAPAARPITIPPVPADLDSSARLARGRTAFASVGCASCHGARGNGDGPAAGSMVDYRGRPIRPRDLVAGPLEQGNSPAEIYRSLATGLDGTPMPGFAGGVPDSTLWDLVAYVRALSHDSARASPKGAVAAQERQARHTVVDGCGCQARRR